MAYNGITVIDGKIVDNTVTGIKRSIKHSAPLSRKEFDELIKDIKDCLLYVEGVDESGYDNSDDDRCGCYSSRAPFGIYYEPDFLDNCEHLLRIDGKIAGVVFFVSHGSREMTYEPFLFDNSIPNSLTLGYSASHSSQYYHINKVSLVRRGENGAPQKGKEIYLRQSKNSPSIY
ncbi:MAG: hypothetical protein J6B29_04135 [Clostridia bacterium]|nr:hypothetical protein [Clostridia bacterium]